MSVIQRSVCCVDYLDIDVSKYIYETYTPSDRARECKSLLNDQYKYHLNIYPKNDILKENIERYRQQNGLWRRCWRNHLRQHGCGPVFQEQEQEQEAMPPRNDSPPPPVSPPPMPPPMPPAAA